MAFTVFPWRNKGESGATKLNRQNLNAAEEAQVSYLENVVAVGSLNLVAPWSNTDSYVVGEAPSRYGIIYKAITPSTGVDPATDNGTYWKAVGYSQGHGAEFNGDWRNTPYGNNGAASPKVAVVNKFVGDFDHTLTQEPNRLQYVRYPALRANGSMRMEARPGDYGVSGKSRTELTATNPGKQYFAGDEVWLTTARLFDPNFPFLEGTGDFNLFHQQFSQDNYAQGGGSSSLVEAVTLPQAKIPVEPLQARSLTAEGTVKIGSQTVAYTSRSADNRFLEGCTGGTGAIAAGTTVEQAVFLTTLSKETTFPTETVEVVSTVGALPAGICETSTSVPFTYTSKDATHFYGCKGGASSESPIKVASGTTVGGIISGGSPSIVLQFSTSGKFFQVQVRGGNKPLNSSEASPFEQSVGLGETAKAEWRIWRLHIIFSTEGNGLVEVWERKAGEQFTLAPQASIEGPNIQSTCGHRLPSYPCTANYNHEGIEDVCHYDGGTKITLDRLKADRFWTEEPPQTVTVPVFEEEGTTNAQKTLLFAETPQNGQTFVGAISGKTWILKGKTTEAEGTWEVLTYAAQQPALRKVVLPLVYENAIISGETALATANKAQFVRVRFREGGIIKSIWVFNGATVAGNMLAAILDTGQAKKGEYTPLWEGIAEAMSGASKWQKLGEPKLKVEPNQEALLAFMSSSTTATFGRGTALLAAAASELPEGALPLASEAKPKLAGTRTFTEAKFAAVTEVNLNTSSQPYMILCLYE